MVLSVFGKRLWRWVPTMMCWEIWLEINNWFFPGYSEPAWKLYRRAKESILFWARRCKGYDRISNGDLHRHWERIVGFAEI